MHRNVVLLLLGGNSVNGSSLIFRLGFMSLKYQDPAYCVTGEVRMGFQDCPKWRRVCLYRLHYLVQIADVIVRILLGDIRSSSYLGIH